MTATTARIVLVHHDPSVRDQIGGWLGPSGHVVECAGDVHEARVLCRDLRPHLVLFDPRTPKLDPARFARWLHGRRWPHYVFVVALVAAVERDSADQAVAAGVDDFLTTPLDRTELLARVKTGLRLVRRESRWRKLAKNDPLTGLLSRRAFLGHLRREWSRARRYRTGLACVMIDVDFFKRINDTSGHRAGDQALRAFAAILEANCRPGDLLARYGGEEFCVLLPETSEDQAIHWSNRVRRRLAESTQLPYQADAPLTASFGVAQLTPEMVSPEQLVDQADQALLAAKRSGRDRVVGLHTLGAPLETDPASAADHRERLR